jgi:branched-chain amino acid transport system ATP-binding protein
MKAQGTTVLLVEQQHVEPALGIADRASTRARHQASAKDLLAGTEIKERYCLA